MPVDIIDSAPAPSARFDNQSPELFGQTPSQTVGPFFHYGLPWAGGADLVGSSDLGARPDLVQEGHFQLHRVERHGEPIGEIVEIGGRVLDAEGAVVTDALIELWQANAAGRYASPADGRDDVALDPSFIGFGRAAIGADGTFRFRTIRPGRVPGPGNSLQAPHVALSIFARGLLKRLSTRLYFADGEGLENDPVLSLVAAQRRDTLIAQQNADGVWWLDVVLGGPGETVFFEL